MVADNANSPKTNRHNLDFSLRRQNTLPRSGSLALVGCSSSKASGIVVVQQVETRLPSDSLTSSTRFKSLGSKCRSHLKLSTATTVGKALKLPTSAPEHVLRYLRQAYGDSQVGALDERLKGVLDLGADDTEADAKFDLTYGEMLPAGVSKALGPERLISSPQVQVLLDLGMGSGKVAMQAFLEFPQLVHVVGIELAHARFDIAAGAIRKLAAKSPARFSCEEVYREAPRNSGRSSCEEDGKDPGGREATRLRLVDDKRVLEFRRGDIFKYSLGAIARADVIIMAVAFPPELVCKTQQLLVHAKQGCRILTYQEDINLKDSHLWNPPAPREFHQLACNGSGDRYSTSWLPKPGHHFYLHEVSGLARRRLSKS